jgi:hypothetical protein
MADIWLCQSNDGNINDANKWKTDAAAKTLTWANLANGDTLCLNGKTGVIIPNTVNIDVGAGTSVEITTAATGGGAAGGNLVSANDCTIRGNITAGSTVPITTITDGKTLTLIGNVTGSAAATGLSLGGSSHHLTMTGNSTGGSDANRHGIYSNGGSTISITGVLTGGSSPGANGISLGNGTNCTINAGSSIVGGSGCEGLAKTTASGTTTITANITGGSGAGKPGLSNGSTGTITITGDLQSGNAARTPAVYNASTGVVTVTGNIINTIAGGAAVLGNIRWTPGIGHSEQYGYDATHYYYYAKTIPKADVKLGVNGDSAGAGAGAPETGTLVAGSGGGRLVGASVLISEG